jgi:hypothetical protein
VNGRVLLGPYGSTGDRRTPSTKIAAIKSNLHGVKLLVEAVGALADVVAVWAGLPPSRPASIEPDSVRRVGTGEKEPATAAWLYETWQAVEEQEDSTVEVDATDEERWNQLYGELPGMVKSTTEKVQSLLDHATQMQTYVDQGRGLRTDERNELREDIDGIGDLADAVGKIVRRLKAPEADDLQFAGDQ